MKYESSFLSHYGITGQKWGVRRFQNLDGTLTEEGKSRYSRGKAYTNELTQNKDKEYKKLIAQSKEWQKARKEADYLLKKYKLDADDGGGGDDTRYSRETLGNAGRKYWELVEKMDFLEDQFDTKASKKAEQKLTEKYGETALSDIKHYQNVNTAIGFITTIGAVSLLAIINKKLKR